VTFRYTVKEIFGTTIQGEGGMTGVPCHFVRLSGCNMWDGRPETREASLCPFCDTDFYKGDKMTAGQINIALIELTTLSARPEWVTVTGGEPMLQLSKSMDLVEHLHRGGWRVAIETNGTVEIPSGVFNEGDYLTMSPKLERSQIIAGPVDSVKLLYPHPDPAMTPDAFADYPAQSHYLQPITAATEEQTTHNRQQAVEYVKRNPWWRLSLQTHLITGVQ